MAYTSSTTVIRSPVDEAFYGSDLALRWMNDKHCEALLNNTMIVTPSFPIERSISKQARLLLLIDYALDIVGDSLSRTICQRMDHPDS